MLCVSDRNSWRVPLPKNQMLRKHSSSSTSLKSHVAFFRICVEVRCLNGLVGREICTWLFLSAIRRCIRRREGIRFCIVGEERLGKLSFFRLRTPEEYSCRVRSQLGDGCGIRTSVVPLPAPRLRNKNRVHCPLASREKSSAQWGRQAD